LQIKSQSLPFSVLMKQSGPLFSVALLTVLSVRLEIFLLNYFHGETQVALYSAVIRLMDGLVIISTAYIATLFPKLVAHQQQAHFYILLRHAIMVMSSIALLLALLGYVLAPWLIQITYGAQYQSAAALLRYLLPALPMLFLTALFGQVLIAVGQQQRFMHSLLLALLCSFAIDLWAIPLWQSVGAVLAYWGREIILLFLLSFWIIHDKKTVVFAH
jgi:O-antigen/teichoic acid export membrane protein